MKVKKITALCLTVAVLLQVMVFSVFAASNRKAYIFTFTWDDANTRGAGSTTVLRHLWNMGYDAGEYLNNSAGTAYSVMQNSKIWVVSTHGGPGSVRLGNSTNMSYIYATQASSGNNRTISTLPSGSLSDIKLVLYAGCQTGLTASNGGNLVSATHAKGAKCVVGWNNTIRVGPSADWIRLLFEKADQEHDVLWECFNHADYWTKDIWGSAYGQELKNRNEAGNVSQYLYN